MRIGIVGPGALGGLLASILSMGKDGETDIRLLDYNHERARHINREGLRYEKDGHETTFDVKAHSDPATVEPLDVLVFCVKSYDVKKSLEFCRNLLHQDCLTLFMQNGIGHLECAGMCGRAAVAFGTTTEGATSLGPGRIRHAGTGSTFCGALTPLVPGQHQRLTELIRCFRAGGLDIDISDSIQAKIWTKLFINVGINALTVINDCPNGELLTIPGVYEQMRDAVDEAVAVAACEGIEAHNAFENTVAVCRKTAANISSMLQDIRKGRRTEIDAINGAIVALATRHHKNVPVNRELVRLVKHIEENNEITLNSPK